MRVLTLPTHFDNEELSELRQAYLNACLELGISLSDSYRLHREHVAELILRLARHGERDLSALQRQAVLRFNRSAA